MTEVERFWKQVDKNGPLMSGISSRCWQWKGSLIDRGYGQFSVREGRKRKVEYPHRYSWKLHYGAIPPEMELHHICNNRACVNPRHLLPLNCTEHSKLHTISRTKCTKGHPYDEDNPLIDGKGYRRCRQCAYENRRRYIERKRSNATQG